MKSGVRWTIKTATQTTRESYSFVKTCIADCGGRVVETTPIIKERAYRITFDVEPDMLLHTCNVMAELATEEIVNIVDGYSAIGIES